MTPIRPEVLAFRAARGQSDADAALDGAVRGMMLDMDPKAKPPSISVQRFHPVDGDFQLISVNGRLFAKTFKDHDADVVASLPRMFIFLKSIASGDGVHAAEARRILYGLRIAAMESPPVD